MKQPLIVLTGPTAVGKTKASIGLAKEIGGEIISADSMQVYQYKEFHVVRFQQMAKEAMKQIYADGHIPILTGGTGFYIQAVLYDIDFTENKGEPEYRRELEEYANKHGAELLHERLRNVDARAAEEIHANNIKRVIRALEYHHLTGECISAHNEAQRAKESPYEFRYFVLNDERSRLYERIDDRVDEMMADGLLQEVEALKKRGYTRDLVSMQGLGYKELLAYLEGEITLEEAVYQIKRNTRHFAKRQLTWFKREKDVIWIDKSTYGYDEAAVLDAMKAQIPFA